MEATRKLHERKEQEKHCYADFIDVKVEKTFNVEVL
jgi:hypothetical protein